MSPARQGGDSLRENGRSVRQQAVLEDGLRKPIAARWARIQLGHDRGARLGFQHRKPSWKIRHLEWEILSANRILGH